MVLEGQALCWVEGIALGVFGMVGVVGMLGVFGVHVGVEVVEVGVRVVVVGFAVWEDMMHVKMEKVEEAEEEVGKDIGVFGMVAIGVAALYHYVPHPFHEYWA